MHLLFVANFPSNTGYAWDTIEAVLRGVGERLVADGHRVSVCYASLEGGPPRGMEGAPFEVFAFDYLGAAGPEGARRFARVLREHGVTALYLTDRPTWSWRYPLFRRAGVRTIFVHDRTSGERARRGAPALAAKRALHRVPGLAADCFIGVSEFVRRRLLEVNGTPPERTFRIYNGIDLECFRERDPSALHRLLGLPTATRIVFCSGRAQPYKGIGTVVDTAALLRDRGAREVAFAYCGDGPALEELRARARKRGLENFHFLGRRGDVPRLLGSATLAVVPSLWAEAFGLTVVEAMAAGVPLVATRTGGIPELVDEGRTGLLVRPGDAEALAGTIGRLLDAPADRERMAAAAREVAWTRFGLANVVESLYRLVMARAVREDERETQALPVEVGAGAGGTPELGHRCGLP